MGTLLDPKPDTCFVKHQNQLALFHKHPDHLSYWSSYWRNSVYLSRLITAGKAGELGEFREVIKRFVNKEHLVLEAGCGPGHLVAALTTLGYRTIGVDYEPAVVQFANANLPGEKIIRGDILALGFPSESLGCYISIGVVEHFVGGPLPALLEARRVLRSAGVALISVPHLNGIRRSHLEGLRDGQEKESNLHFHQYYYNKEDFSQFLAQAGFRIIESYPYAVEAFLIREHPIVARFWRSRFARESVKRCLRRSFQAAPRYLKHRYAHMMMYICRPSGEGSIQGMDSSVSNRMAYSQMDREITKKVNFTLLP